VIVCRCVFVFFAKKILIKNNTIYSWVVFINEDVSFAHLLENNNCRIEF
jgi:hypothetical protein